MVIFQDKSNKSYEKMNYLIIMTFSFLFLIIYIIYFYLVASYIKNNYKSKKICVFWIDYLIILITTIIFILFYVANLIINNTDRIENVNSLSSDFLSISTNTSLCFLCLTIIQNLLFDNITALLLSNKMNKIKDIKDQDYFALFQKIKNIRIVDIFKISTHFIFLIIFGIIQVFLTALFVFEYTDLKFEQNGIFSLKYYFQFLVRYYHLIVLFFVVISIIIMNKTKKNLLQKEYYNPNTFAQKIYNVHFSQIVYFSDVITFKLVDDLIINIPPFLFLSINQYTVFALILSEFSILLFILIGGNVYFVIDKDSKAAKLTKNIKYWFCFKYINFHFGEKDHRTIYNEFNFTYTKEEQNILNNLNMTIIQNLEKNLITEQKSELYTLTYTELEGKINNNKLKNNKFDLSIVSEFYAIQKLLMMYFDKNSGIYDLTMQKMDESGFAFKKLNYFDNRKSRRTFSIRQSIKNKDDYLFNIDRISRISIMDSNNIISSIKTTNNKIFYSLEEKELYEELKNKHNLNEESYELKIESILPQYFFELFPFYQLKINSIMKSINPTQNLKLFNFFVEQSTKNEINMEKNLYYTYDLLLMYEVYDKNDFLDFNELKKIISLYKTNLLNRVKNMNFTFLPLIIGIFNIELFGNEKIVILYRNPLYFSSFNKYNFWINFYITEEPEKIKVSSILNDVIDINEIEIKNTLQLNEADYDEIKENIEKDYIFLKEVNNIYPIVHLFIGDETNLTKDDLSNKIYKNIYNESSLIGDVSQHHDFEGLIDVLDSNNNSINNLNVDDIGDANNNDCFDEINSLLDREYYSVFGNDEHTIKIYFTHLFRKNCKLNLREDNEEHKINSTSYCNYLEEQLINYLSKKKLFNEDDKNIKKE